MNNIQWVKAKPAEVKLDLDVEIDWTDTNVNGVTIRDPAGNVLRIVKGEYSGMQALIPAPPPMVDKWKLHGKVAGFPVEQVFDYESQAESVERKLRSEVGDHLEITIEPVKVPA